MAKKKGEIRVVDGDVIGPVPNDLIYTRGQAVFVPHVWTDHTQLRGTNYGPQNTELINPIGRYLGNKVKSVLQDAANQARTELSEARRPEKKLLAICTHCGQRDRHVNPATQLCDDPIRCERRRVWREMEWKSSSSESTASAPSARATSSTGSSVSVTTAEAPATSVTERRSMSKFQSWEKVTGALLAGHVIRIPDKESPQVTGRLASQPGIKGVYRVNVRATTTGVVTWLTPKESK